ncbi:hypothetical protein B0T20DRAFT_394702 [Sordaria brevicollis]|uniref:Uncharacterized protein n=1 Tax=Sordaria brevicollis TaxID=83679 RepID=A0AAE0U9V4_SORBR|nr:hypothetical protein B0T20DRAFT_394702 [Sordaria brevicollis]
MSGTPANNAVKVIRATQARDALDNFEGNVGLNLTILRDESPVRNALLRQHAGPINLTVRSNLEAVFVQLNGKEAASDCQICRHGKGPFVKCVRHPKVGEGSCANCLYRRHAYACTLRVSKDTDSDDIPLSQPRKRQERNLTGPFTKRIVEKRRKTIATETAGRYDEATAKTSTQLEEPMPVPAFQQQRLQSLLEPTPAPTPPIPTTQLDIDEVPIHGPGTALGSVADHWLKSLAFSKYGSPAPTQAYNGNDYASSSTLVENNRLANGQPPVAVRDNEYCLNNATGTMRDSSYPHSLAPLRGNGGANLDDDTSKPLLAYLPKNVSPDVLRSIAQYHQDLADDLRMEAKRLEREMRRERERDWGIQATRQTPYE